MHSYKTLLIALLVVVAVILAGGYLAYTSQIDSIIKSRYNQLAAIKKLKVKQITGWQNERLGDANAIKNNPLVTDHLISYLKGEDKTVESRILTWFNTLKKSYRYKDIILTNNDFLTVLSTNENLHYSREHLKEYTFQQGKNGVNISQLHIDEKSGIHYSIKIDLVDNEKNIGHLIIIIDPNQFLFPLIQEWPSPSKTAETILIRNEGDSILVLNELRHKSETALKYRVPTTEDKKMPIIAAAKGYTGMFRGYDYRGAKVLADVDKIPETNWYIITKIDEDEIFDELSSSLFKSVVIVLLLISLSYVLFLLSYRKYRTNTLQKEFQLEKEKARLSNLYSTLSQINQTIVREQSRAELILKIPKLPVKFGNFAACSFSMKDELTGEIKIEAFYGTIKYFDSILNDDSSFKIADLSVSTIVENKTKVHNRLSADKEDWMKVAAKNGIKSCASAPIKFYGKTVGSLTLFSGDEDSFNDSEIKLLNEIVSDISFSLELIDKNEKHREAQRQIIENERRLKTLFSNLPGIAYRCAYDKDWTMEFMSEGALNITGYTPDEIVNNKIVSYGELIHPQDSEYVWEEVSRAVENKSSFTIMYRITPRDGNYRWVWERGMPIFNNKNEVTAVEGFINDVTDLKEAQEKLENSEKYFRYLFHHNPLPMWIYDLQTYKFLDVNDAAVSKYGYSRIEFLSKTLYDIRPTEEFEKLNEDLKKDRSSHSESGEWKHKLKSGKVIDVLIISHEIEFEDKSAVLVVSLDITDRKKAEHALIEAKEKAEASEKLKTEFLAQMSHEIRTPVNVILSFSSLIKEAIYSKIEDDLKEGFTAIDHAGFRLIRTIDSILNMAQITSGAFDFRPEKLDLHSDILYPLSIEFSSLAKSKNLDFVFENNCDKRRIIGDKYSLSQTFANLIDNAIKYTEKGYVKVTIECDEKFVWVYIEDSGIGMSEDYLSRLFTPFSQEETGYSRRYEGTGLGLALVKNYCILNDAEIEVRSEKNKGTTFIIRLKSEKD